jgi:aryl-alcohol dehydrogenase-like predicted oxidoreductase
MEITRTLGRSGIEVSALGFGCWAIGGEWQDPDGQPLGWGKVDDEESVRAVRRALDLGVTFFDTADTYGAGHSERVLGRALGKRRDDVVVATKWGNVFDEDTRTRTGGDDTPAYARRALTASLTRLGADHVDLYQLHLSDADPERAAELRDVCEEFVREGLIRAYAWSTDDPARAAVFAEGKHCKIGRAHV